ncbi:MAG: arsenate reductase family protein [Opitutaceae bacterium]
MLKIYTLSNCGTCRAATKWLRNRGVAFKEVAIRETPPTLPELRKMLSAHTGELRRLFNTSGQDYREQKLADKLPAISEDAALALLAGNGRLVKRPFLIGNGVALVGFNEKRWAAAIGGEQVDC